LLVAPTIACGPAELDVELINGDTVALAQGELITNGFRYPLPVIAPGQSTRVTAEA
jgi:hypothetical protein